MNIFNKIINKIKIKLKKQIVFKIKKKYLKSNSIESDKLIVFFVPEEVDVIGGGVLSISTIYQTVNELKYIHGCNVFLSFLPHIKTLNYKFLKFSNENVIFNFNEIMEMNTNPKFVEFHIPDYMVSFFKKKNNNMFNFFKWQPQIDEIKINILNQNDLILKNVSFKEDLLEITSNITMTVAHEKYATLEKRNYYNVPLHLFSPWLSPTPYIDKKFSNKENIIIISPDDIDRVPSDTIITKNEILEKISNYLPDFEIIIIQNMSYDKYKDLISRAKFTITFGEGLDGYFVESILSGSISFAVYNDVFFTKTFKNLPTVYDSFDSLFNNIVNDIKRYNKCEEHTKYNIKLKKIVEDIYSYNRLKLNIKKYYLNDIDFM